MSMVGRLVLAALLLRLFSAHLRTHSSSSSMNRPPLSITAKCHLPQSCATTSPACQTPDNVFLHRQAQGKSFSFAPRARFTVPSSLWVIARLGRRSSGMRRIAPTQRRSTVFYSLDVLVGDFFQGVAVGLDVVCLLPSPLSKDAQQDMVMYGAEIGVVILAEGPRCVSVQQGLDHFAFQLPHIECERHVWSVGVPPCTFLHGPTPLYIPSTILLYCCMYYYRRRGNQEESRE